MHQRVQYHLQESMVIYIVFFFFLMVEFPRIQYVAAENECQPKRCRGSGPLIRFPFWLKDHQPEKCGHPGFELSCHRMNGPEFKLQFPATATVNNIVIPLQVKAKVHDIDYKSQVIKISVVQSSCLPKQVFNLNYLSASLFKIYSPEVAGYGLTLYNCSEQLSSSSIMGNVDCLSSLGHQVYVFPTDTPLDLVPESYCVKMYNISYVPQKVFTKSVEWDIVTALHWPRPFCGKCEANEKYCRLKNNSTGDETECFHISRQAENRKGLAVCASLMSLVVMVILYHAISKKMRKETNRRKIEQFLEDYRTLGPTRYTYADIKKITGGFKERLGQGGYGTVYKGKLSNDIFVAVKVLNNAKGSGEEFINEVGTIGKIHHVNVVRLVGYCADGHRRALVYEFLPNDSLQKFISSSDQGQKLGWEKLHKIAIGIAKGIDYLHQGCNQRIVHFDIKPHNILLDHNLNPKVADFGLAKLCSKDQSILSMTAARGTIGYIAPEVFSRNFGNVSYRSDIYSFGMLLLHKVARQKNFDAAAHDGSQVFFPEWVYNQLEKREDIAIQVENDDEIMIVKKLIIVGLWCSQWNPSDRPSMKVAIQMLEGENMPAIPPNPFAASSSPCMCSDDSVSHSRSELSSIFQESVSNNEVVISV